MKFSCGIIAPVLLFWCGAAAQAAVITSLSNTGVDATHVVLSNGSSDSHYVVDDGPPQVLALVDNSLNPAGFSDSLSRSVVAPTGYPAFVTTFDLTNMYPATATISGQWATNVTQGAFDILLNGVSIFATPPTGTGTFSIPAGSNFLPHENVLTFIAVDLSDDPSPTFLRVEMEGAAAVPEPSTVIMWGAGASVLALFVGRRRSHRG